MTTAIQVALLVGIALAMPACSGQWIDLLAMLCLLPVCALGTWAHVKYAKGGDVWRQLCNRFWVGWVLVLPVSWFLGFILSFGCPVVFAMTEALNLPESLALFCCTLGVFTSMAAVEESLKLAESRPADNSGCIPAPELHVLFGCATALGLGTGASYLLVIVLRAMIDPLVHFVCRGAHYSGTSFVEYDCAVDASVARMLVLIAGCVCFALPVQLLASYHVGLIAARIDLLKAPADTTHSGHYPIASVICFRGLYGAVFICTLKVTGGGGFVAALAMSVSYFVYVTRYETTMMPTDDLQHVGGTAPLSSVREV